MIVLSFFFFLMIRRPPRSTLFPYTTALPIYAEHGAEGPAHARRAGQRARVRPDAHAAAGARAGAAGVGGQAVRREPVGDRKSTRLNSSHANISYAVFCLKKKKKLHSHLRAHF